MKASILAPTAQNINQAAEVLRQGGLVAMPTETVYGLAGNALNASAVTQIFDTKERPTFDPLIVHLLDDPSYYRVSGIASLGLIDSGQLSDEARASAEKLMAEFWPGPLTLVLPRGEKVSDLVTSGLPTVALRMPAHPVAQALLRASGLPLAAPSANRFGRISPTSAIDVMDELGDRIPLILDGGNCEKGVESTVIFLEGTGAGVKFKLLRPGAIPVEEIEARSGIRVEIASKGISVASTQAMSSPGMLKGHYSPASKLRILVDVLDKTTDQELLSLIEGWKAPKELSGIALLLFQGATDTAISRLSQVFNSPVTALALSQAGSLEEAARNLFASLRALDQTGTALILAEPCPTRRGLGHAIMDRLERASAGSGDAKEQPRRPQ